MPHFGLNVYTNVDALAHCFSIFFQSWFLFQTVVPCSVSLCSSIVPWFPIYAIFTCALQISWRYLLPPHREKTLIYSVTIFGGGTTTKEVIKVK